MHSLLWAPVVLLVYYLALWARVARSRRTGTIAPRYAAPAELSPAAVRYAVIGGTDGKSIAASLAHLAFCKVIALTRSGAGFEIRRQAPNPTDTPPEEAVLLDLVFAFGDPNVVTPADSKRMDGMVAGVEGAMLKHHGGEFFTSNYGWVALGVVVSLVWSVAYAAASSSQEGAFAVAWSLCFSLILGAVLFVRALPAWRDALSGRLHGGGLFNAVIVMPLMLLMVGAAIWATARMTSSQVAAAVFALAAINVLFGSRLRAPTARGRELLDEIEGYRRFLLSVEQDRLDRLSAPGQSSTLDAHMAYAIALDIKEAWGDHLCDVFFMANVSKG